MSPNANSDRTPDMEVQSVIEAFEQILETMPDDRVALETLCEAYEQSGQKEQAVEYLKRLGGLILAESDAKAAVEIGRKLRRFAAGNADTLQLADRLEALAAPKKDAISTPRSTETRRKTNLIANEMTLAWNLLQAGEVNQEEYSSIIHDLTENSSKKQELPVTVLHVLQDRNFKGLERVLQFLVNDGKLPLIPLNSFEILRGVYNLLPMDSMKHRGAIAFEVMGKDLLIAVLNPYDTDLQEEVRMITNRECHFYLATAADYDLALDNIKKSEATAQAKEKEREKAKEKSA